MKPHTFPSLSFLATIFLAGILFQTSCSSGKQVTTSKEEILQAISGDNWMFTAQHANPQYGRSRNVNGVYEVKCTKDKLEVYLPYFGRSYSGGGAYTNQNPLDFKSSVFSLNKEEDKKGNRVVTIKPNDYNEVQSMVFTFYNTGNALLDVQLTNRSAISFTGIIAPLK